MQDLNDLYYFAMVVEHGGFERVQDHDDLAGRPRFVSAQRRGPAGPGVAGWGA